jgi:hypothetical protein
LLGGLDATSSRISIKQSQMPSQMATSANSSKSQKKSPGAVVAEGYPGAVVMLPQSLTGPLSRAASEKYADSSAHIAHRHLCGTSESRACIVSV